MSKEELTGDNKLVCFRLSLWKLFSFLDRSGLFWAVCATTEFYMLVSHLVIQVLFTILQNSFRNLFNSTWENSTPQTLCLHDREPFRAWTPQQSALWIIKVILLFELSRCAVAVNSEETVRSRLAFSASLKFLSSELIFKFYPIFILIPFCTWFVTLDLLFNQIC